MMDYDKFRIPRYLMKSEKLIVEDLAEHDLLKT